MADLRVQKLSRTAKLLVQHLGGRAPASDPAFEYWRPGGTEPRVLWRGPSERLVVSDSRAPAELLALLTRSATGLPLVLTDVSHALEVLRAEGAGFREALAADVGVSLTDRDFPVGHCARTCFAQASVTLHRTGAESWDLYVERPLLRAVHDWLMRNAGAPR